MFRILYVNLRESSILKIWIDSRKKYWIFKWLKGEIQEETRKMVSFKHLELITQSKSMFVTTYLALEFNPSCTTDFSASVQ